jgi:putative ABC transport system permease protein
MLKNYLLSAIRNLIRRKRHSLINIFGLALGIGVSTVLILYLSFELSYDKWHEDFASIHRVILTRYNQGQLRDRIPLTGYGLGPALVHDIPEIECQVRMHKMFAGAVVTSQSNKTEVIFQEENIFFADSNFFTLFSFHDIAGDALTALNNKSALVITENIARKYFGSTDCIGKTMRFSGGWVNGDVAIGAVISNLPANSHFSFDFILPIQNILESSQYKEDNGWGWKNFITYVKIKDPADVGKVDAKMPGFLSRYLGEEFKATNTKIEVSFQPLVKIHTTPGLAFETQAIISPNTVYTLIGVIIFILFIAYSNYINLSTATAMERSKEVAVKKIIGARPTQLVFQFLFESVFLNTASIGIGLCIAWSLFPFLGEMAGKEMTLNLLDDNVLMLVSAYFVVGILISGLYPAILLSSFKIINSLKGTTITGNKFFSFRRSLVLLQFSAALILIGSTTAIYMQIVFMQGQVNGELMDRVLVVGGPRLLDDNVRRERLFEFKDAMKSLASVEDVTTSISLPGNGYNFSTPMRKFGNSLESSKNGNVVWVDPDFLSTYDMKITAGKAWNPDSETDMQGVIVNEVSLKEFDLGTAENALTEKLVFENDTFPVLGVIENSHWTSLHSPYEPLVLSAWKIAGRMFSVRFTAGVNNQNTIKQVESIFTKVFPGNPFNYYFLSESYNRQYKAENNFGKIVGVFSILAIIIACLGLWGLTSYSITKRIKEIGIRKTLGASTYHISLLFTKEYLILIVIAACISGPVIFYGVNAWLSSFAFKAPIGIQIFLVPLALLISISFLTIGIEVMRATKSNPVNSLKTQ